jgi:hypothetical protein
MNPGECIESDGQTLTQPHTRARTGSVSNEVIKRTSHSFGTGDFHCTVSNGKHGAEEDVQRLHVLVIYEDLSTGSRAWHAFDQVIRQLELLVDVTVNLWRFDLMDDPAVFEQTVEEAAKADIVLVAAHGESGLPAAVNLWLSKWLNRLGDKPYALAMSLDAAVGNMPEAGRLMEALLTIVRSAGVDVFLQVAGGVQTESGSAADDLRLRTQVSNSMMDRSARAFEGHPYWGWGINE